jgi:phenylalanyl-tRNA synthetase beta chain
MRASILPELLNVIKLNQNHGIDRLKIFEIGNCFLDNKEILKMSGFVVGNLFKNQWKDAKRNIDFFDVKSNIENIFKNFNIGVEFTKSEDIKILNPHCSASIFVNKKNIGFLGMLSPIVQKKIDVTGDVFVFELECDFLESVKIRKYKEFSKFPSIQRDISFLIDKSIAWSQIKTDIECACGELLQKISLFDVYQDDKMQENEKSIAVNLLFQHKSRTLIDKEIDDLIASAISMLESNFKVKLRGKK